MEKRLRALPAAAQLSYLRRARPFPAELRNEKKPVYLAAEFDDGRPLRVDEGTAGTVFLGKQARSAHLQRH